MLQKDVPYIHCVEQALELTPKGMELILLGDIRARFQEPENAREEYLATELAERGLVKMTSHFMPRRRYRKAVHCMWQMRQEGRQGMVRGD